MAILRGGIPSRFWTGIGCLTAPILAFGVLARADVATLNGQIAGATNTVLDYLIQDVCVDANDVPIPGDPATCASHRDARIGEAIPYLRTDFDTLHGNVTYQAVWSYPVAGTNGNLMIMNGKSNQGAFGQDYVFSFDLNRDGYDLAEAAGPEPSFIRTSDGACFDQEISQSASQREDGWILAGSNGLSGGLVHGILIQALTPGHPANCGGSSSHAEDVWNPPASVAYETGKTLSTIVSYHFADVDLTTENNAMERYFFTREYGFTRWESWIPQSRCLDAGFPGSYASEGFPSLCDPSQSPLRGRCNPSNIPATAVWGGQTWIRIDCRDSTNVIELKTPLIPLDNQMGNADGLADVDPAAVWEAAAEGAPVARGLPPGSYQGSCTGCTISGTVLSCSCLDIAGVAHPSSLELGSSNAPVNNNNGALSF